MVGEWFVVLKQRKSLIHHAGKDLDENGADGSVLRFRCGSGSPVTTADKR
jgi:hypothetical protein